MKIKSLLVALFITFSLVSIINLSGCSAGAHIGPVGAGASVR